MKKLNILTTVLLSLSQYVIAQSITVTGNVASRQGYPVHFAFVQDNLNKNGIFTDSLGNFKLLVSPKSKLKVTCKGFRDTLVNVNNNATVSVVLTSDGTPGTPADADAGSSDIARNSFNDQINLNRPGAQVYAGQGALMAQFTTKEATQGSRYLFPNWVHGFVIDNKDSLVKDQSYLFNYDKMDGGLVLALDKKSVIIVDKDKVKSFTLFDQLNQPYVFESMPAIDANHYVQLLSKGNKYRIYKLIKTKFIKADYKTDGIASTGNKYDEYADDADYYVLNAQNNQVQKISLKKKSIKAAFSSEADKLNKFMTDHSSDTIDDTYLSSLGDYMNN